MTTSQGQEEPEQARVGSLAQQLGVPPLPQLAWLSCYQATPEFAKPPQRKGTSMLQGRG